MNNRFMPIDYGRFHGDPPPPPDEADSDVVSEDLVYMPGPPQTQGNLHVGHGFNAVAPPPRMNFNNVKQSGSSRPNASKPNPFKKKTPPAVPQRKQFGDSTINNILGAKPPAPKINPLMMEVQGNSMFRNQKQKYNDNKTIPRKPMKTYTPAPQAISKSKLTNMSDMLEQSLNFGGKKGPTKESNYKSKASNQEVEYVNLEAMNVHKGAMPHFKVGVAEDGKTPLMQLGQVVETVTEQRQTAPRPRVPAKNEARRRSILRSVDVSGMPPLPEDVADYPPPPVPTRAYQNTSYSDEPPPPPSFDEMRFAPPKRGNQNGSSNRPLPTVNSPLPSSQPEIEYVDLDSIGIKNGRKPHFKVGVAEDGKTPMMQLGQVIETLVPAPEEPVKPKPRQKRKPRRGSVLRTVDAGLPSPSDIMDDPPPPSHVYGKQPNSFSIAKQQADNAKFNEHPPTFDTPLQGLPMQSPLFKSPEQPVEEHTRRISDMGAGASVADDHDDISAAGQVAKEFVTWINKFRQDPRSAIPFLRSRIEKFVGQGRKHYQVDATNVFLTEEGPAAVEDCIDFLNRSHKPRPELQYSIHASNACKRHVEESGGTGQYTHQLQDGSKPIDRVVDELGKDHSVVAVAESIKYELREASDIREDVLDLMIDDGVEGRGNRKNIFGEWDLIGVWSGAHSVSNTMCTIVFVQNRSNIEDRMDRTAEIIDEGLAEPKGWIQKQQRIALENGVVQVTNSFKMQNGSEQQVVGSLPLVAI